MRSYAVYACQNDSNDLWFGIDWLKWVRVFSAVDLLSLKRCRHKVLSSLAWPSSRVVGLHALGVIGACASLIGGDSAQGVWTSIPCSGVGPAGSDRSGSCVWFAWC